MSENVYTKHKKEEIKLKTFTRNLLQLSTAPDKEKKEDEDDAGK